MPPLFSWTSQNAPLARQPLGWFKMVACDDGANYPTDGDDLGKHRSLRRIAGRWDIVKDNQSTVQYCSQVMVQVAKGDFRKYTINSEYIAYTQLKQRHIGQDENDLRSVMTVAR
ncbi:MAG: hypothetical protein FD153_759 [Rhodospirillaceae bacterium]|nr:MAG: hypothetical protein FD153_759 [Rhodospirillaceae bacterium]